MIKFMLFLSFHYIQFKGEEIVGLKYSSCVPQIIKYKIKQYPLNYIGIFPLATLLPLSYLYFAAANFFHLKTGLFFWKLPVYR